MKFSGKLLVSEWKYCKAANSLIKIVGSNSCHESVIGGTKVLVDLA